MSNLNKSEKQLTIIKMTETERGYEMEDSEDEINYDYDLEIDTTNPIYNFLTFGGSNHE